MKQSYTLIDRGKHQWTVFYPEQNSKVPTVDTNEFLVSSNDEYLLVDPGGIEIFPNLLSSLVQHIDSQKIKKIFASHQDPDIASSILLWGEVNPDLQVYIPWIWESFMPHYGGNNKSFIPIPDKGMEIQLNGLELQAIPAHFLHSSGNFHLYDPEAKVFFSGDIGTAFLNPDERYLFVNDFDSHIKKAEYFHKRVIGNENYKNLWCEHVSRLDIDFLCPQHGAIYTGDHIKKFIDWLYHLKVADVSNRGFFS
ncbi:MAG: flavorubredoxin [bacterium]|jgi:flavorubredoxin